MFEDDGAGGKGGEGEGGEVGREGEETGEEEVRAWVGLIDASLFSSSF